MKSIIKLALGYILKYKKKSFAIILSIILSVSLMIGIGTIILSIQNINIESARNKSGDYHYSYKINKKQLESICANKKYKDFNILKKSITKKGDLIENPNVIELSYIDENFIDLYGSKLLKGNFPKNVNEIVLEEWVLYNFNINHEIGNIISLGNTKYKLVGILSDSEVAKNNESMKGFLNLNTSTSTNENYEIYIKFDENMNLKNQNKAFLKTFNINKKYNYINRDLVEQLEPNMQIDKTNFSLIGIFQALKLNINLIIFIMGIFCSFIVYSIFNISVTERISEYGILKAMGASNTRLYIILFAELIIYLVIGFPLGTILGIFGSKLIYTKFPNIFENNSYNVVNFLVSKKIIVYGFLFMLILLSIITFIFVRKLNKVSIIEAIYKMIDDNYKIKNKEKVYSLKYKNMLNILSYKYITRKKSTLISIIISISLGGITFLTSNYIGILTKNNFELTLKADDGLNSDYQLVMQSSDFSPGISKKDINKIKNIEGIKQVHPVSYYLGGIILDEDQLLMKEFFKESNESPRLKEYFNGICTKDKNNNKYLLKSNIYGYDDIMINNLKDYLIDGDIDKNKMNKDNSVLVRLPMDGTGSYKSLDIKVGDKIKVKYQKNFETTDISIKFPTDDIYRNDYIEKEYTVAGTLKSVMASNDYFIGDSGTDIIMTNESFSNNFNLDQYNMVSITKDSDTNHKIVANNIQNVIKNIPRCIMKDYTIEIQNQISIVNKKLLLMYGVTSILFIISLFNIVNNMSHSIITRKNDLGILRGMGITNIGIWKMILKEGFFYGVISSILTISGAVIAQGISYYVVKNIYLYISPKFFINIHLYIIIIILNLLVSIIAVSIPVKNILNKSAIENIYQLE